MSKKRPIKQRSADSTGLSEQDSIIEWMARHEDAAQSVVENWLYTHPQAAKDLYLKYGHFLGLEPVAPVSHVSSSKTMRSYISVPNATIIQNTHKRKPLEELRKLEKQQLFVEILKDVVSPDVDVNHLTHKILLNVLLLTSADRSSLFLVEGTGDDQILVSRLFDVRESTSVNDAIHDDCDAIKMPVGVGIAGMVAKTGQPINLKDAYEDPRFNREVDVETGYVTKSILCMPIKTAEGQVIGVAQVINKNFGSGEFTKEDEEDFQMYLNFCAIGIVNSQLLDQSLTLSRKLQIILHLAKGLFEDTTKLEVMMDKVMQKSMELIPCHHASVLLLDKDNTEEVIFSETFQLDHPAMMSDSIISVRSVELESVSDVNIAKHVATTAAPVIMSSVGNQNSNYPNLKLSQDTKSILSIPIFDKDGKVLGIVQLTNKLNQTCFSDDDVKSLEVFATFCGLGLHNVLMYEEMVHTTARNKVAFDVLSYHASSSIEDANKLMKLQIPESSDYHLTSFDFSDASLPEDHTVLASVRIFIDSGMVEAFKISAQTLFRWILTVKKNYRPVTYHNWRHAFNVTQMMFAIFKNGGTVAAMLSKLEQFALLIACLCHDLDHRGTNNAFQVKSGSVLAQLYTTSTMEHHHFDHCIMILNSEGNQILNGLSSANYAKIMRILESAILSTDLQVYFKVREPFKKSVKGNTFKWEKDSDRNVLRGMMMTACDVGAITKPWKVQKVVANLVANEFFEQGDRERNDLQVEPDAMMDRRKKDELPKMQVGFIDFICLPLYQSLSDLIPDVKPLLDGTLSNRDKWNTLAQDPKAVLPETERDNPPEPMLPEISSSLGIDHSSDVAPTMTATVPPAEENVGDASAQDKLESGPRVGWRDSTGSDDSSAMASSVQQKDKVKKVRRSPHHADKKHTMKKCAMS